MSGKRGRRRGLPHQDDSPTVRQAAPYDEHEPSEPAPPGRARVGPADLAARFGLSPEELNLDLGPLGRLT